MPSITFIATQDIKKGQKVTLDFTTGEFSIIDSNEPELQPKEEPNIIEDDDHRLDDLLI